MNHLLREHAPITEELWGEIDSEAKERLVPSLAARRLVDFSGPKGWEYSSTNLGRVEAIPGGTTDGLVARRRVVLPLAEIKAPFLLSRSELAAGSRGAADVDYGPLDDAAQISAVAENRAVFHGWEEAGIDGIAPESPHKPIKAGAKLDQYPAAVARAVELLLRSGVGGPYGLALGRDDYTKVVETTEHGGYLLLDHLRKILGGPVVWAPGVTGGVVLSLRGGDFLFESGQDLSVGYDNHDHEYVELYLEQSFSFRVATPEAAVAITKVA